MRCIMAVMDQKGLFSGSGMCKAGNFGIYTSHAVFHVAVHRP